MKILMIANFVTLPWEGGNSRFPYILEKLDCKNNDVEFITSNFRHGTKKHRELPKEEIKKLDYKITLINEPGYRKNVSLKRFHSHKILARNIKKYLDKKEGKPDVIYCAVPSLDVAKVVTKYAKKNNIRLIIDIQDLWPEAFEMVFNIPVISNIIFYPMKRQANYIYSNADEVVAVSDTYVNRALKVNKKVDKGLSVFLGTDLNIFDKYKEENKIEFNDDFIRLAYIGTLGHSYDIKCIIDAIKILNKKGINNIKFIIMGDGPLKNNFEEYAKQENVDCEFTGKLEYQKMVGMLCACDIAVNPITGKSAASIINKVGDYAAAGLPVINTQNSDEYRELIDKYETGFNCSNGNSADIAEKLEIFIKNKEKRINCGQSNRKLAEEKFDRNKNYERIINLIY